MWSLVIITDIALVALLSWMYLPANSCTYLDSCIPVSVCTQMYKKLVLIEMFFQYGDKFICRNSNKLIEGIAKKYYRLNIVSLGCLCK